jgi:hypothetical protein
MGNLRLLITLKKLLLITALTATTTFAQTPEQIIAQAIADGLRQHQATEIYWNSRGYYLDGYGNYRRETPRNTREIYRQRHYDNDEILRALFFDYEDP